MRPDFDEVSLCQSQYFIGRKNLSIRLVVNRRITPCPDLFHRLLALAFSQGF
jgi:hypothetical protein